MFTNVKFTCSKLLAYIIVFIGAGYAFALKQYDAGVLLIGMGASLQGGKSFMTMRRDLYGQTKENKESPDGSASKNG
jgi:hypothetical protein